MKEERWWSECGMRMLYVLVALERRVLSRRLCDVRIDVQILKRGDIQLTLAGTTWEQPSPPA